MKVSTKAKTQRETPPTGALWRVLVGVVCVLGLLLSNCVIDPLLLAPRSEVTDASTPEAVTDKAKACYDECLAKFEDSAKAIDTCSKSCLFKPDPTIDCYDPCIKQGNSGSVCGDKCYNNSSLSETDECYLSCYKSGLAGSDCDNKVKTFASCFASTKERKCLSLCVLDTISVCYEPCTNAGNTAEACKLRVNEFSTCLKANKGAEVCKTICVK